MTARHDIFAQSNRYFACAIMLPSAVGREPFGYSEEEREMRRTKQGFEIIENCPTPTCEFCREENHFGACAELLAERERAIKAGEGRPVPHTRAGP